jgi:protocatechuate 3,4-dioxygenase alpha subunit
MTASTPSQTIGPFFRFGLAWFHGHRLVDGGFPGAVVLGGQVFDGAGDPVADAVIEIEQAAPPGGAPPGWRGFGRSFTDHDGGYQFLTAKPRRVDDRQAPHIEVSVFARGLMQRCWTRCYFPDEPAANAADPLLQAVAADELRTSLIATVDGDRLRFDIWLQGERETAFFEW